jgi:hypothetical protein
MLSVEPPKHLRDGAALADELINHILEVSLSISVSDFVLPRDVSPLSAPLASSWPCP